ncbi:MAG TPA: MMPL family transporter [Acholeplasmataceae bacterium]|nr:MMPL family transporter [Acholeplasmataceae bacterium]
MKKLMIVILTVVFVGLSLFLMGRVDVNYDMKKYLPDDDELIEGIKLHDELYGPSSYTYLMLKDASLNQALDAQSDILAIEHVTQVDFLDSVLNQLNYGILLASVDSATQTELNTTLTTLMGTGLSFIESFHQIVMGSPDTLVGPIKDQIERYENDGYYKMMIGMDLSTTSADLEITIDHIEAFIEEKNLDYALVGGVMSDLFVRDAIEGEVLKITFILIPLVLVILLLMTPSYADLIVFIIISGVAIVVNLGTNIIFPDISFITQSMAIALQLAISLDYIIFIVHRYHKDREDKDPNPAMKETLKRVASPVVASAVTTGVSFIALAFMRFSIGVDIGLVFLKAVFLSAISSLVLGPVVIKWLDLWIKKSKHKVFIPKFGKFATFVYKLRYVFLGVFVAVIIPAYYFQSQNTFIYGESALIGSDGSSYDNNLNEMIKIFGNDNQIVIITTQDPTKEAMLYQELMTRDGLHITSVQSMVYYQSIITDPNVLAGLSLNFYQDGYQRMILSIDLKEEDETTESVLMEIKEIIDNLDFEKSYMIGSSPAAFSIKDVIESDYLYVTLIALVLVMIVILVTFKNWILPVILPSVIMTSVFLAMSVPYFIGSSLAFLGYLIVSTILLGATIDYAILFTKRYIELRETDDVHLSIEHAIEDSAPSITTSALIFGIAGLSLGFISSVLAIQQIGLAIALGALFGLISVLVLLPQLILIFDKLITRSKVRMK